MAEFFRFFHMNYEGNEIGCFGILILAAAVAIVVVAQGFQLAGNRKVATAGLWIGCVTALTSALTIAAHISIIMGR